VDTIENLSGQRDQAAGAYHAPVDTLASSALQPDADGGGEPVVSITFSRTRGHPRQRVRRSGAGVAGGDKVFRDLVLARIIEPARALDSACVLDEAGAGSAAGSTRWSTCSPVPTRRCASDSAPPLLPSRSARPVMFTCSRVDDPDKLRAVILEIATDLTR
jgi:hypothetical protein